LIGNRVSEAVELEGLDRAEVGVLAYPEFFMPTPVAEPIMAAVIATSSVPDLNDAVAEAGTA